jgi:hypothetical protein
MKTFLLCAFVLIILVGIILFYRDSYVKRKIRKLAVERYSIVAPLIQKLNAGIAISKLEVHTMAQDPALRHAVFHVLSAYNRSDLFPADFLTYEKAAEGLLVNWLEFPTELGSSPAEIEFITVVRMHDNEPLDYYVFKYKTKLPHSLGQHYWMIGVAGPYRETSKPYEVVLRVFSRFNILDTISPEDEVQWVHTNISQT